MGVPKFYRWISERYPCLSEVIKEYQVPEFDNLYLDMNGIIHVCSHPNDDDPHFRISEEQIFADIFHYIDFLFKIIKPKKVFFMAVDGVAPRAKMNQQRGRRFRTARDAEILEQKAKDSGEILPTEARFDSNCITPGTAFMARLHEKLKSFVCYKMSSDKLWQPVRVYLSGHETPGEGEHKIMDFIRFEKSQPGYDPNTRHCLYGLDADLIMLGLSSHEPHFSLLREEVRFGKKNQKRTTSPEETTFHLLHLSLMREYLGYEFSPVKEKLPFEFDLEKIIDDFVFMSFLVGNDFIPHLPHLHIHHDALPVLYKNYMDVLPALGGYINEGGYLNLERFEVFLAKLAEYDYNKFSEGNPDFKIFESKSINHSFAFDVLGKSELDDKIADLRIMSCLTKDSAENMSDEDDEPLLNLEFADHKRDYYCTKLEYDSVTPEVLKEQAEGYVRAIQWNLHYYYNGVVSWSWYYPHHYSPYISDVKDFKDMKIDFDLGKPFLPFQQLLAVLPAASKSLLPEVYQDLMCNPDSPLIDFYPSDFETDLNGKQQEWEALVLIPFINEKLLLKCTSEADKTLNPEELKRNGHGPHLLYTYSEQSLGQCESFLPNYFPNIPSNHAKYVEIDQDAFRLQPECIKKGLCDGVQLETFFPGFPTLKHIHHTAKLRHAKVRVFQAPSHRENMILTVNESIEQDVREVSNSLFGKNIYVRWPHLQEAYVVSVSDGKMKLSCTEGGVDPLKLVEKQLSPNEKDIFRKECMSIKEYYYHRLGVDVGEIDILIHTNTFMGSKLVCGVNCSIEEEKQWSTLPVCYPLQVIVKDIAVHCPEFKGKKTLKDVFCVGSPAFMLGYPYYGSMGEVVDNDTEAYKGKIIIKFSIPAEPNLFSVIKNKRNLSSVHYAPGYILAQQLGLKNMFVSRLTGTFLVQTNSKESISPNRVNVGLNLKFNAKNEEVHGFSKKGEDGKWLYSDNVLKTLSEYVKKFPDFVEKLNSLVKEDVVYLEDLYPDGDGQEMVREISKWLKSQDCSSAERHACGIEQLDDGVVRGIEEATNDSQVKDNVLCKEIEVKPQILFSPFFSKGCSVPDPGTTFHLFDRVINVRPTSSVPLGLRGTIIGIRPADKACDYIFEVLFDKEFFGALTLRSSAKRGYMMSPSGLINITYGERLSRDVGSPLNRSQCKSEKNKEGGTMKSSLRQKGNRNALVSTNFGGHSKQVADEGSVVVGSPIKLFKKYPQDQFPLSSNQPFYKADVKNYASEINHSPNSSFSALNYASSATQSNVGTQFVTPKAYPVGAAANKNNAPLQSFEDSWNDLLKKTKTEVSPSKQTAVMGSSLHNKQEPAREHFQQGKHLVNSHSRNNSSALTFPVQQPLMPSIPSSVQPPLMPSIPPSVQPPLIPNVSSYNTRSVATNLMDLCLYYQMAAPQYTYRNGPNGLVSATVHLQGGMKFIGDQFCDKFQATESAASKALLQVNQIGSRINYINRFPLQQYPYRRNLNFPSTAAVLRHPPPPSSLCIPHSFLDENKKFMAGGQFNSFHYTQVNSSAFVPGAVHDSNFTYREVKNVPTTVKEPTESVQNSVSQSSMFVPLQVSMNQTKKSKDDINQEKLPKEEWPSLPSNNNNNSEKFAADESLGVWQQCGPPQINQNFESRTSNSVVSPSQMGGHEKYGKNPSGPVFTTLSANSHSSQKKKKPQKTRKPRIAANFTNQMNKQ